jgi:hypothetical protein
MVQLVAINREKPTACLSGDDFVQEYVKDLL